MTWEARPVEFGRVERFFMRLLFALAAASQIPESLEHLSISQPNGLARIVNLGFLLDAQVLAILRYVQWVALLLYVLRVGWALVLPYLALLSIAAGTVNNSHGAISHHFQILSLVLIAQTCAHYYARFRQRETVDPGGENLMIFWSQQMIVATYLVSALTKLINSSVKWFIEAPFIAVQVVKTNDQSYYNMLDASARTADIAMAEWIVQHPLLVTIMMAGGFFLELLAPLALLGRRFALLFGVGLLAFHKAIDFVMELQFVYNEYLLWIYFVNVPFWMIVAARWWSSRGAQPASAS